MSDYSKLINQLAKQLYDGKLLPSDLNSDLLEKTLGDIRSGLSSGLGDSFLNYENNAVRNLSLNQNLYRFSGAKTYQELAKMNLFLKDKGSFQDFQKEALKINDQYNKSFLQAEFDTANRSGVMVDKWSKYEGQKDLYPNLQYKTANDSRVRQEHADLQDIIKPINDPFWMSWYPPNGFRCRCYVTQTDAEPTKGTPTIKPDAGFNNNVALSNMVFDEGDHPYFVFPAADAKKIKESFENIKLSSPDYNIVYQTKKAKLEVSTWADPNDIELNYKYAKILVEKLGIDVKIRNHTDIPGITNPELEINGSTADLKNIDSVKGITNGFASAKKQMGMTKSNYSVVFSLDQLKKIKLEDITKQLANKFNPTRGKNIKSVFFIKGGKAIELTREMILKKDFKKLSGIL
ncbi:phage minor head protein [Flavobacterium sp. N1994]|uniref:phage minor head protein n=1 Tax=Flavobacterium sp. N1994 TaxID=2986827 RepID=UPI0022239D2A|nr:phage minor head protein [Flavobacterium sp. N1994]